jgi:MraZ protein
MYGTRRCTIDAKARLTLPADIRKDFPDKRVVLTPFKHECLYGFTPEGFERWINSLFESNGRSYDDRNANDRMLRRRLRGAAVELTLDSAGRLALGKLDAVDQSLRPGTPTRREQMGLDHDVMVIGNGDRFEVWNAEQWLANEAALDDMFDQLFDVE